MSSKTLDKRQRYDINLTSLKTRSAWEDTTSWCPATVNKSEQHQGANIINEWQVACHLLTHVMWHHRPKHITVWSMDPVNEHLLPSYVFGWPKSLHPHGHIFLGGKMIFDSPLSTSSLRCSRHLSIGEKSNFHAFKYTIYMCRFYYLSNVPLQWEDVKISDQIIWCYWKTHFLMRFSKRSGMLPCINLFSSIAWAGIRQKMKMMQFLLYCGIWMYPRTENASQSLGALSFKK